MCISGGAPLQGPLHERFEEATHARLVEGYGLTECSGVVSTNPYQAENRAGTIGQQLPETRSACSTRTIPARTRRRASRASWRSRGRR